MEIFSTLTLVNVDNQNADEYKFGFAHTVSGTYAIGDTQNWWTDWLDTIHGAQTSKLSHYLSKCVSRVANSGTLADYDITAHLDGSPHGSPIGTAAYTLSDAGLNPAEGNQLAVVVALSAGSSFQPVEGVTGTVPTPEQAVDYGAPATHTGQLKVRARYQNRFYFGPIATGLVAANAQHNPDLSAGGTLGPDLAIATEAMIPATVHNRTWNAWSRRGAQVVPLTGGWWDHAIHTRRRRTFEPHQRTTFGTP
jgi:hypothetical protein